jgi:hypothetical protein
VKIDLPETLRNRGATTDKDARPLNCVVETRAKVNRLVKRPSIDPAYTVDAGGGQLITVVNTPDGETPVIITADVLNNGPTELATNLAFTIEPS